MRLFLVCLMLWTVPINAAENEPSIDWTDPALSQFVQAQSFDCSRKTCTQIRSCAEACHKLLVCGDTRRDGDGDGIPCENLCSRRC